MAQLEFAEKDSYFNKALLPEGVFHWSEAKDHIDEEISIYGEVASTYFDWRRYDAECERWAGHDVEIKVPPTFIEIGAKYPNEELLKVVIWGRDRKNFSTPPDAMYKGKAVVVRGMPYRYNDNDFVYVQVVSPTAMKVVKPIVGLYISDSLYHRESELFEHEQCQRVFRHSEQGNVYDDDSDYHSESRSYKYVDDWGHDVDQMGDYFYDSEGNCVPDFAVRKEPLYPPSWDW